MLKESELRALELRKSQHAIARAVREERLKVGFERLSPEKQAIETLSELHDEVFNGGFSQYFTNAWGRNCHTTLRHLETLGCAVQRRLLHAMIERIESAGLDPADRNGIGLFIFGRKEERDFEERLNKEYYANMDSFYEAVLRFALSHKEAFEIE